MNTNAIIKECLKSLKSLNTKKDKHLHIFIDYNHRIVNGCIMVERNPIVVFNKVF